MLAIAGSLVQGSYNQGLLRAAQELASDWVEVQFFDIGTLPFFNEDVEATGDPEPVRRFKDAIRASNALLSTMARYQEYLRTRSIGRLDQQVAVSCGTSRWRLWVLSWVNRDRQTRRNPARSARAHWRHRGT